MPRSSASSVGPVDPTPLRLNARTSGGGYVVNDLSTNGVFVNGERIDGSQLLGRSDVLRVGNEEFRFYADITPAAEAPAVPAPMIT